MLIPLSTIHEGKRIRKDYQNLEALKDSLVQFGQLQPILVSDPTPDGQHTLIAGGRRLRAMTELGWLSCQVLTMSSVTEETLRAMELEENTQRAEMSWQERMCSIAAIYEARRTSKILSGDGKYTLKQAGQIFGISYTWLAMCIKIADCINANDEEIIACTTAADAVKLLAGRAEAEALKLAQSFQTAEMQNRHAANVAAMAIPRSNSITLSDTAFADPFDLTDLTLSPESTPIDISEFLSDVRASPAPITVDTSPYMILGDSIRTIMPAMGPSSVDHIITDIPYGIDMGDLDTNLRIDVTKNEHDVEENIELMEGFLTQSFRVLKDKGYCIFFFDLSHFERLLGIARAVGFRPQEWPLIWHKTTAARNNAAQVNWTKDYESIMVLRKGVCTLNSVQSTSVLRGGLTTEERAQYNHPFTKPYNVVSSLLNAVTSPGQTILDPFAGEFSMVCHCIKHGLNPIGIEKMETHYLKGQHHVAKSITAKLRTA